MPPRAMRTRCSLKGTSSCLPVSPQSRKAPVELTSLTSRKANCPTVAYGISVVATGRSSESRYTNTRNSLPGCMSSLT